MASAAQIAANRLNAMRSTGPRTEAGKAASRLNALRHGADAALSVIPGEDPADLEQLTRAYHDQFRPSTPEEQFLVDTIVNSDWLRRRYLRIETEMTNHLLAEQDPCDNPLGALYCSDTPGARALERIRRHYTRPPAAPGSAPPASSTASAAAPPTTSSSASRPCPAPRPSPAQKSLILQTRRPALASFRQLPRQPRRPPKSRPDPPPPTRASPSVYEPNARARQ